jgi:DNA-binding response OmpR family regulator
VSPVLTGPLVVDFSRKVVIVAGEEIALSDREWGILVYLAEHAGSWCSLQDIGRAVWGVEWLLGDGASIRMSITRLRSRLGPGRSLIETHSRNRGLRRLRLDTPVECVYTHE